MSNRQLGCQLDEVARIPIDKRLASLLIYSYSFDLKTFSLRNDFRIKCCVDRLRSQPEGVAHDYVLKGIYSDVYPAASHPGYPSRK
jgi:hypothetical protein